MADNDGESGLDQLTTAMNDIARQIGEMNPNDPLRSERIRELHSLKELSKSTKAEQNKFIYEKMDTLACEVGAVKPRDARRADIVSKIIRLSHLILK